MEKNISNRKIKCHEFRDAVLALQPIDHQSKLALKRHYQDCDHCRINNRDIQWILADQKWPLLKEEDPEALRLSILQKVARHRSGISVRSLTPIKNVAAVISFLLCFSFLVELYNIQGKKTIGQTSASINVELQVVANKRLPKLPTLNKKIRACYGLRKINGGDCSTIKILKNKLRIKPL